MPEIIFPMSTSPGVKPGESGGRLINCFVEPAPAGSRSKYRWPRVPGLNPRFTVGASTPRGALKLGTQLIVINGTTAYSITKAAGVYTVSALTGTVPGTGPVIMARNMNATPQIMVITSAGPVTIISGTVATYSDADLPSPESVCFKDGYFFFGIGDGRCFNSDINATNVNALGYTTAESSPDGMVRVISAGSSILMLGENSGEFWSDTAEAPPAFPFSRSSVIPVGGFGLYAATGFEEGFPGDPLFVANDSSVRLVQGYSAARISNPDLEKLIAAIEDRSTLIASCYVAAGRPVYVLSCDDWTWEYCPAHVGNDIAAPPHWRERMSYGSTRWRVQFAVNAFDEWLAFDASSNAVYLIDPDYKREDADPLVWEIRSIQDHSFPARAVIYRASFDFETGVGIASGIAPIETAPVVQVSLSFDGGKTFGNPLFRDLGRQGQFSKIDCWRLGMTQRLGVQYRLAISDPVDVALYGGAHNVEQRSA